MDGFDAEQIWLQLDQATVPLLKRVRKLLPKAASEPRLLLPNNEEDLEGGQTETCHLTSAGTCRPACKTAAAACSAAVSGGLI